MGSWVITADKFLTHEQAHALTTHLAERRDLAIARGNDTQAIKDYYMVRGLLESGLRVFEFCALVNGDFAGHKLNVRRGKGNKPRTVLLTRATALMLQEWTEVKVQLGFDPAPSAAMFPSRYGRHYTTRGVQKRIELIFDTLQLPESLSTHNLRHTYCSFLLSGRKVGLPTARMNMGHSSLTTTSLYAHATDSLEDVDLLAAPTSYFNNKCEPQQGTTRKNPNHSPRALGPTANFKAGHLPFRKGTT